MILTEKRKYCRKNCNCEKCNKPVQRYDASADVNAPLTLEEHFENFTDTVAEVAENFLRGKKGKERQAKRIERKTERKDARNEKRISRIKTRQGIREEKLTKLQGATEQTKAEGNIKLQNLQAQTQADQVNQLASQVQPEAKPITASQTPTAQPSADSSAPLYQTLPDVAPQGTEQGQEEGQTETAKGIEAPTTEAPKKSKTMVYIIIAVAVIGAYYLMKKK